MLCLIVFVLRNTSNILCDSIFVKNSIKMSKYLYIALAVLVVALGFALGRIHTLNEKYSVAAANIKAYDMELSSEKSKNVVYQLTVEQLEYFNDSTLKELENTRQELRIKDKNLKALQSVFSGFVRTDTVCFTDTVFFTPGFKADTLISDEWYSLSLGLEYPSLVKVTPKFISKKHIIVSTRKETVNPPKKFFLFRWFQKRHKVLNIDVIEKNPYVEGESSKYIEIIK